MSGACWSTWAARLAWVGVFTILPSFTGAAAAQQRENFRPGFAWKPGIRIEATESRVGVIREGAVSDSGLVSRATYTITVSEHSDGLLVS